MMLHLLEYSPIYFYSLCSPSEGGDGAGDPAVREGQGGEGGTTGPAHPDLPGTGSKSRLKASGLEFPSSSHLSVTAACDQ